MSSTAESGAGASSEVPAILVLPTRRDVAMETLYVQASKGHKSLDYTEYLSHGESRWRVRFHRDFYEDQSFGVAERWDGARWQEVFNCSPQRLKLGGHSTVEEPCYWEPDASLDAQYIVSMAAKVIGEVAA